MGNTSNKVKIYEIYNYKDLRYAIYPHTTDRNKFCYNTSKGNESDFNKFDSICLAIKAAKRYIGNHG